MVNTTGWDALDIICSSNRVLDDLARCMQQEILPFPVYKMQIISRPWTEIQPWQELRGFILDKKLTALSQQSAKANINLVNQKEIIAEEAQKFV